MRYQREREKEREREGERERERERERDVNRQQHGRHARTRKEALGARCRPLAAGYS